MSDDDNDNDIFKGVGNFDDEEEQTDDEEQEQELKEKEAERRHWYDEKVKAAGQRREENRKQYQNNNGFTTGGKKSSGSGFADPVMETYRAVMRHYNFVTLEETDEILYYDNGVYLRGGDIIIKKTAEQLFEQSMSNRTVGEVEGHVRRKTYRKRSEFDADINIHNLKNGLYNWRTDEFTPNSEQSKEPYLSMNQKPIYYDASVGRHPTKFIKFLKEVVYPEDIWTLIELMAYTFLRDNPFDIITILLGGGSNGKSVLFGVLTALHGASNVSNVSLKTIIERPFGLYDLVGKDCNLDAEMSSGIIQDAAILKKITGKQLIRVEQKNQKAFDARIYAKEWLSCNTLPHIGIEDQNEAYYRRNIIVGFPNKFEEKDYRHGCLACQWEEAQDRAQGIFNQDIDLTDKLTTPEELSAIFNLLMYALRGILKNKSIAVNEQTIQERRQKYELAVNPIDVFLRLAIDPETTERDATRKDTAYLAYLKFCKFYKLSVISNTMFGKRLKQHGIKDGRDTFEGQTVRVWWIRLTDEYLKVKLEQETLEESGIWGV